MKQLRIVFMGTPEFAVTTLQALLNAAYEVVGVVTSPDRPAGRGRKLRQSAVKEYAVAQGLPVLQPTSLKASTFIKDLKALDANLQIVVAFRMLPKIVWQMPAYGTVNLHASLLPDYRGAAPINWVLINGEATTGVTTFYIDEKIDTGEIILQLPVAIARDETAGSLHDKLSLTGAELVVETVRRIEAGTVEPTVQQHDKACNVAPKLSPEVCQINWNLSGDGIVNHIRGLNPYPGAWTYLVNGEDIIKIKIFDSTYRKAEHNEVIGSIMADKDKLEVAVKNGFIKVNSLQFPGKKRLETKEVLNGLRLDKKAHMS